jgi:hypothetical protein
MKKIIVIGAVSILAVNSAMSMEVRPFIGGNLSINGVVWDNELRKEAKANIGKLPEAFIGFGLEAGARFATTNIYNAGITLAYDYMFDSETDINDDMKDYISSFDIGFSAISITFDNYIRVSGKKEHRRDIVIGLGVASATERVHLDPTSQGENLGLEEEKSDDDGTRVVFKVGYNHQIARNADWYVNGRAFVPTSSDDEVDAFFNLSTGLRFVF